MTIKFTTDAAALNKALSVVALVSPQAQATPTQDRVYLFVVQGERCSVYSKAGAHEARASFPISDVEGEGPFMYPADYINEFRFIKGSVSFTAYEEDGAHKVGYKFGTSGSVDRVTVDPGQSIMAGLESNIRKAMDGQEATTFSVKLLLDAFASVRPFVASDNDKAAADNFKNIQIFGNDDPDLAKKAQGYMLASNGTKACYFYTDAFVGKGLVTPGSQLGLIEKFMKTADTMRVYETAKGYYLVNDKDDVLGWPKSIDTYKKFAYYQKNDNVVAQVDVSEIKAQLQYMRAALNREKTKIRLHFDPDAKTIHFTSADEGSNTSSLLVAVDRVEEARTDGPLTANVNVNNMLDIFTGAKGSTIEFRIMIVPKSAQRPKDMYLFRTIDEFLMDEQGEIVGGSGVETVPEGVNVCRVTRYTPGVN